MYFQKLHAYLHIFLQATNRIKIVQTETSCYINKDRPLFNVTLKEDTVLSTCHSFILENTLADDENKVFVDTDTQTLESGGIVESSSVQTHIIFSKDCDVFTGNDLSETSILENDDLTCFKAKACSWSQTLKVCDQ